MLIKKVIHVQCVPPPSLSSPNWGGLTSWPKLNWVVVPVASVSFPVSQGGLHSHCVRHCIVQAGCNQADESRISRNTLRASLCLRSAARYPYTQARTHKYVAKPLKIKHKNVQYLYTHACVHIHVLHSILLHNRNSFDGLGKVQAAESLSCFAYSCLVNH